MRATKLFPSKLARAVHIAQARYFAAVEATDRGRHVSLVELAMRKLEWERALTAEIADRVEIAKRQMAH